MNSDETHLEVAFFFEANFSEKQECSAYRKLVYAQVYCSLAQGLMGT